MIHLVTWLPLPYQRTVCQTLSDAYGAAFVAWFAERTHEDFPYKSDPQNSFIHHYLSEVGYWEFFKQLKSDPDAVVILSGWSSPMTNKSLLVTTLLRIPIFIWADHPHPRQRSPVSAFVRRFYLRLLALSASGFLACGTPTVEHLVSLGIKRSDIVNFPYWVELPSEWSLPKRCADEDAARRPLRLLAVGRHVPVKQFEVAIRAVALANEKAGKKLAELILVGDGPQRASLEALAHSLPSNASTSFRGWLEITEVYRELKEADALVITSRFEAYAVVVLDAMAAGRPVLASAGVTAALDRDEGTGAIRFHPIGDVECLADQIALVASDDESLSRASLASRATAENWPPSRAVTFLDQVLSKVKQGRTLLKAKQHRSSRLRGTAKIAEELELMEKSAVAGGGLS